jgi:hypothetical protein
MPHFPFVQIANTKSVDNKSTLLNFLADVVEKRFPDVQDFGEELGNLDRASKGIDWIVCVFSNTVIFLRLLPLLGFSKTLGLALGAAASITAGALSAGCIMRNVSLLCLALTTAAAAGRDDNSECNSFLFWSVSQ